MPKAKSNFDADDARKSVERFTRKQKSIEQMQEEKRQAAIRLELQDLPDILKREWLPKIRKAAREGEKEISVRVFSEEVGWTGCKLLKKLGYEAEYYVYRFHGSDDDPGTDWPSIKISWWYKVSL